MKRRSENGNGGKEKVGQRKYERYWRREGRERGEKGRARGGGACCVEGHRGALL